MSIHIFNPIPSCEEKITRLLAKKALYEDLPPFPIPPSKEAIAKCPHTTCYRMPNRAPKSILGKCAYYRWRFDDFLKRHSNCGHQPPDYYQDYGFKYCTKFRQILKPLLSKAGKKWLDTAKLYLQIYMEQGLHEYSFPAIQHRTGSQPHPPDRGNADMEGGSEKNTTPGETMIKVDKDIELSNSKFRSFAFNTHPAAYINAGIIELQLCDKILIGLTPDIKEWTDKETWEQAGDVGKVQLEDWHSKVQRRIDSMKQKLKDWYQDVRNFFF